MLLSDFNRGGIHSRLNDDGLWLQIRKIEIKFLRLVGRIERGACRDRGDTDKRQRHLGTIGKHHGYRIVSANADAIERFGGLFNLIDQSRIRKTGAFWRQYGRGLGRSSRLRL
jgi:hypothetical protein